VAQNVQMRLRIRPGGSLRSLDQMQPFIAPMQLEEEEQSHWLVSLGDWTSDTQIFLLELVVPPLGSGSHPLAQLNLRYDLPSARANNQTVSQVIGAEVREASEAPQEIDPTVKYWLERLVAYRLQSRAWQDLESGHVEDATQRLRMAGTRLLGAGEENLARTVQHEATRLLNSGNTTAEGRKRIKYGTRGLMSQESSSQN
jgi:hypothetical protein